MRKIVHVIVDLSVGGAQNMLYKLLAGMNREEFESEVISMRESGPIGDKIQSLGIPIHELGMRPGIPSPSTVFQLAGILRRTHPDVVQTWMYHADLLGGLSARLAGKKLPVVWNIRHSHLDPEVDKRATIIIGKLCARLSRLLPNRILSCSESGRSVHIAMGYSAPKMQVIPNGFDLSAYKPCPSARLSVREELSIPAQAPLIGLVGRYHAMKDHHCFVQAAKMLHDRFPEVHYILCGEGVVWSNTELAEWIEQAGLRPVFRLLGRRDDLPRLHPAFDVASLSSRYGEGFPNVVGEAMACGVPCVVTDVGDSGYIVGKTGFTVPPKDPQALAGAWVKMMELGLEGRKALGEQARERVEQEFDIAAIVCRYEQLYRELCHTL